MRSRIQQVFRDHFGAYAAARPLPAHVQKAARSISSCRTAARGYHLLECPHGHHRRKVYNACRERSCPVCGFMQTERWVRKQTGKLVDGEYHHVVFTTAHELNVLWRYNRERFVQRLFEAGWQTLRELLGDPKYLGALPGALGAVHTWQVRLLEHVHLHMLVSAGGVDASGEWVAPKKKCLLPQAVVAQKFRGKFLCLLRRDLNGGVLRPPPGLSRERCLTLINRLDRRRRAADKWHVQVLPRYAHGQGVVLYLGRYLRGGPIAERRIAHYDGARLVLRDKSGGTFELDAGEFIHRFLQHVPPPRVHMVRAYGLFHHAHRDLLDRARARHGQPPCESADPTWGELCAGLFNGEAPRCPVCGSPLLRLDLRPPPPARMPPRNHSPPEREHAA